MDSVAGRVHVAYTSNPNAADQWISKYAHEALHGSWQRFGLDAEYRGAAGGHAISRMQCEYTSPDGPDSSDTQPDPRKSSRETMKLKSLKRVPVHTVQLAVQRPEGAKAPYEVLVYHMASNLSGTKNGKVIVSKNLARLLASNYAGEAIWLRFDLTLSLIQPRRSHLTVFRIFRRIRRRGHR